MKTPSEINQALIAETDRIWLTEPEEIKCIRLGVFPSGVGSYGQYFSNLVFVNGDLRSLATWVTPGMVVNILNDPDFSLAQCQKIFAWLNLVNVDFLAYCGLVKFAQFAHDIIEAAPLYKTKEEYQETIKVWYVYANRLYLWVHEVFPWGLGSAFPKVTEENLQFMLKGMKDNSVDKHFEKYGPQLKELD
jgi:hypothetical protein